MEQQDLLSSYRKDLKERILVTSMRAFKGVSRKTQL